MTELVGTALTPALVPTGTLVATNYAADVASVSFTAATSGIHTVVAYDWWNGLAGVGNYSLRME